MGLSEVSTLLDHHRTKQLTVWLEVRWPLRFSTALNAARFSLLQLISALRPHWPRPWASSDR